MELLWEKTHNATKPEAGPDVSLALKVSEVTVEVLGPGLWSLQGAIVLIRISSKKNVLCQALPGEYKKRLF